MAHNVLASKINKELTKRDINGKFIKGNGCRIGTKRPDLIIRNKTDKMRKIIKDRYINSRIYLVKCKYCGKESYMPKYKCNYLFCNKICFNNWLKTDEKIKERCRSNALKANKISALLSKGTKREWLSIRNKNPEFQSKCRKGSQNSPNKAEKKIIKLLNDNNLPFRFVGNGDVMIERYNPDFIYNNKIIELYGDYWHKLPKTLERNFQREKRYTELGYLFLIIWEHELKDMAKVLNKIKEFSNGS